MVLYLNELNAQLKRLPHSGAKMRFTENHDQPRCASKLFRPV